MSSQIQTFDELVSKLQKDNDQFFPQLDYKRNNIVRELQNDKVKYTVNDALNVLKQYSIFSNEAIHMLLDATIRNHDWKTLQNEIIHNIQEELGSETLEVPHLELMRQGYREELLFDPDKVEPWSSTRAFLDTMKDIFRNDDNAFSAGALYSFEYNAILEFHIVEKIFLHIVGADYSKSKSLLYYYIRGHKEFEINHSEDVLNSMRSYFTKYDDKLFSKFEHGFLIVASSINKWWLDLDYELNRNKYFHFEIDIPDLKKSIFKENN
ncbi:DUF3865 domain-containing protein [Leptospira sp. GIMC2001]|uniref:DUF3865 domain-containing protein n=1 Tax=Leptospira sp. GIMC2001 TaxID=1513297 RepID=UPI0023493F67|nr:DUF3865 domain-containing protein [Leptospira sp. GIMC2001]WCL49786.1 DUF3865 domain-containing protein [Leptospira sp. GIMC2001]